MSNVGIDDARVRLEPLLRPGEHLRWSGRPDPGVLFSAGDLFAVPFSLLWCGSLVFWEYQAISQGSPLLFVLWGIPLILIGLYFLFGRFIFKRNRKLRTVYGLTDSRAIIATGERSVQDVSIKGVPVRTRRSRDGSHASVIFGTGRSYFFQNIGLDYMNRGRTPELGFFDVSDAEALTRELDQVR